MKKIFIYTLIFTFLCTGLISAKRKKKDPFYKSFFEKARFIMTKPEIEIYNHLPDNQSKENFIKEFWKKRDPDPNTEENESKIEFEKRIDYANKWFKENRPKGRGWDTERGRIFLQLGMPDRREWGQAPYVDYVQRAVTTKWMPLERWIYYRYSLFLEFIDNQGFGNFVLRRYPATLLSAIDRARFTLNLVEMESLKNAFRFDVYFNQENIIIQIPVYLMYLMYL